MNASVIFYLMLTKLYLVYGLSTELEKNVNIIEDAVDLEIPNETDVVEIWDESSIENPEELGAYTEGDMLFPYDIARNGLKAEWTRWPNAEIPFEITGKFNEEDLMKIQEAIKIYRNNTCVRFIPKKSSHGTWLQITNTKSGCWSTVGRAKGNQQGGPQQLNLQAPACLKRIGTILHELMHAIGFLHEQNRPERDNFVRIVYKNIKPGHEHNFNKAKENTVNDFGVSYDYGSVMHYSANAFSQNGQATIVSKEPNTQIGQRRSLSTKDIRKINLMYNCNM